MKPNGKTEVWVLYTKTMPSERCRALLSVFGVVVVALVLVANHVFTSATRRSNVIKGSWSKGHRQRSCGGLLPGDGRVLPQSAFYQDVAGSQCVPKAVLGIHQTHYRVASAAAPKRSGLCDQTLFLWRRRVVAKGYVRAAAITKSHRWQNGGCRVCFPQRFPSWY